MCNKGKDDRNVTYVLCSVNNTVFPDKNVMFNLRFDVSKDMLVDGMINAYNVTRNVVLHAHASAAHEDIDQSNNYKRLEIPIVFSSELVLSG